MTLFCQYEQGVFPTPARWSELPPRQEAKLIRRRLRARRFERWDWTFSGPSAETLLDEVADEGDFDWCDWEPDAWPDEWRIGSVA